MKTASPRAPFDPDIRAENVLIPGSVFYPGNALKNENWELKLESNCNLVLYENGDNVVWDTNTGGKADTCYLRMETSGNLVLYNGSGENMWASNTAGAGYSVLVLQNDRNLVICGPAIWATSTNTFGLGLPFPAENDTNATTGTLSMF